MFVATEVFIKTTLCGWTCLSTPPAGGWRWLTPRWLVEVAQPRIWTCSYAQPSTAPHPYRRWPSLAATDGGVRPHASPMTQGHDAAAGRSRMAVCGPSVGVDGCALRSANWPPRWPPHRAAPMRRPRPRLATRRAGSKRSAACPPVLGHAKIPAHPTQLITLREHDWLASKVLLTAVRAHSIRSVTSRTGQKAVTVSVCAGQGRCGGRDRV